MYHLGCHSKGNFTRKHLQDELNQLYLGNEFNLDVKYAQILTVIIVSLIYAPGLPVLYISTFSFLIVTYWIDKYLLLCVCRKPKLIDNKLANLVHKLLKYTLIVHLIWSIWIYGNPKLFLKSN